MSEQCPTCGARTYPAADLRPIAAIVADAAFQTGVMRSVITGEAQGRGACRARFAAIWAARTVHAPSLPQLGRAFGDRDHTTIANALRRAEAMRGSDPAFRMLTDRLVSLATERTAR